MLRRRYSTATSLQIVCRISFGLEVAILALSSGKVDKEVEKADFSMGKYVEGCNRVQQRKGRMLRRLEGINIAGLIRMTANSLTGKPSLG